MSAKTAAKMWDGQVYLCHYSEPVAKILYQKFFRYPDTTVVYGKWPHILREQRDAYEANQHEQRNGTEEAGNAAGSSASASASTSTAADAQPNDEKKEDHPPPPPDTPPLNGTATGHDNTQATTDAGEARPPSPAKEGMGLKREGSLKKVELQSRKRGSATISSAVGQRIRKLSSLSSSPDFRAAGDSNSTLPAPKPRSSSLSSSAPPIFTSAPATSSSSSSSAVPPDDAAHANGNAAPEYETMETMPSDASLVLPSPPVTPSRTPDPSPPASSSKSALETSAGSSLLNMEEMSSWVRSSHSQLLRPSSSTGNIQLQSELTRSSPFNRKSPRGRLLNSSADGSDHTTPISTSTHGLMFAHELEPFQCLVVFYTSTYGIPSTETRKLKKVFGPEAVSRMEQRLLDLFDGEQVVGSSFVTETGSLPCKFVVCTSLARHMSALSQDYAYNAFRSAMNAIQSHNKAHREDPIKTILCPAMEAVSANPYNMVQQMAVCYEFWDWHIFWDGGVLPFTSADRDSIMKGIHASAPGVPELAEQLEQYIASGTLASRGLIYETELKILIKWLGDSEKADKSKSSKSSKKKNPDEIPRTAIEKRTLAQVLVNIMKRQDMYPFTLAANQIYSGINGPSLEYIMKLSNDGSIRIYEEILPAHIKIEDIIAYGTSGRVCRADWDGRGVAVKFFHAYQPQLFRNELTLITLARHPKLVQAFGGFCDTRNAYLVTELMEMNLYQLLQKQRDLPFSVKVKIARDVAEAMECLHSRGIIHRDLKSVNVLLTLSPEIVAKVCDFGLSRVADKDNMMTSNVGTVAWIAPEVFANKKYNEKVDVYSYGIILFELVTHQLPFKDLPSFKIPTVVLKGQRPIPAPDLASQFPKDFLALMKQCLHDNPNRRPSFAQILTRIIALQPLPPPQPVHHNHPSDEEISDDSDDALTREDLSTTGSVSGPEATALEELRHACANLIQTSRLVNDDLLKKCLRARGHKVDRARQLVKHYLGWYKILNNGNPIKITDVRQHIESHLVYYPEGAVDKMGRAILFYDTCKFRVDTMAEAPLMRAILYCLERILEKPENQTRGVVLLSPVDTFGSANYTIRTEKSFFYTFTKYVPVMMQKLIFVNPPTWFAYIHAMSTPLLGSLADAVVTCTDDTLHEFIAPENTVPDIKGGKYEFDMDKWIRTRYEIEGIEYIS